MVYTLHSRLSVEVTDKKLAMLSIRRLLWYLYKLDRIADVTVRKDASLDKFLALSKLPRADRVL